ncbi:hypothetical protein [Rubrivirga marina]|uniref:Uncharacterized protein n=1 Tax=Rubrivirga marina TaxID=1196024 RepID=A0A271J0S7_9BACT|nr:hypothetical protein [Rubrivirga marina]PAP77063.1 hypothetical protein BSZ37_11795 [Rubrivirga marina]
MSKSDVGLLALNLVTLLMAVVGLTAQHVDPMGMALALTLVTTIVNGGALLRRGRRPAPMPRLPEADELDARHVLDLDARLEALERAYGDAADAAKWRALVASGQVSGPAADAPEAGEAARGHTRNGVA